MSSYTITIAPDDRSRATTTLRVEVTETDTRIIELVVQAGEGNGLSVSQLPAVDIDRLLRAVAPAVPATVVGTTGPGTRPRRDGAGGNGPADRSSKAGLTGRSTPAGQSRATAATARSYRRAPADLAAVLARTGSATAVATHYQVPKYTAESWIRTMRRRSARGQ